METNTSGITWSPAFSNAQADCLHTEDDTYLSMQEGGICPNIPREVNIEINIFKTSTSGTFDYNNGGTKI